MKIILSGGGTGGHIYPALAIAGELKERLPEVQLLYVGTPAGMESRIVPEAGLAYASLNVSGIDRTSMLKASKSIVKFPNSFFQARNIIKDFEPDIIVGTGGYVSFPIVLAGTFMGIKTIIHEQNAYPGLANRNLAKRVDRVLLTFPEASQYLDSENIKITGLPVRKQMMHTDKQQSRQSLGLDQNLFTILAFGGSLGAKTINNALLDFIDRSRGENLQIIWITGEAAYEEIQEKLTEKYDLETIRPQITLLPYMNNMEQAMGAADLAVCRAGASTVSELEVIGLPAILVPFPFAADNHQEKNARALVDKNAAYLVIDEFFDGTELHKKVQEIQKQPEKLRIMGQNMLKEAKPNALKEIVDEILKLAPNQP
ncbi:MAG TPA: undecaprenyldiphospho-muramoylpentapeptide beta-N-acetylglucosaminyltransferase [Syntrophomonas sp.]|nr:undecaprenyldiphospho-muramoylpentapeptide beta-N-acetylglucosaminyltransferase [Syntrophomonas sp.]